MAQDPRTYYVKNCAAAQQSQISDATRRKEFFDKIRKVGDIEVLNDIGLGEISEGLRTLSKVSDSIRVGQSTLPSGTDQGENGTNYVLETVGINPAAVETAKRLNPGVANRATGQAKAIYEKVKQGEFEANDIPETFSDLQNLSTLMSGIFTDSKQTSSTREYEQCGASPYATDLISYAPKFQFLFIVQIEFNEGYTDLGTLETAFVVKHSNRPTINFEYEDINMYNFWTKVPKKSVYEPITMRFYDDNWNQAMTFYNSYLKAMSPIANMDFPQSMENTGVYERQSMAFSNINQSETWPGPTPTHSYASSYGPTNIDDQKDIIKRITLFHVYREGRLMNVYRFFNPRILNLTLDDLDMTQTGEGNEVSFQFSYDGLNILTGYPTNPETDKGFAPDYNIEQLSGSANAKYPLKYHGEFDATGQGVTDKGTPPGGFWSKATEVGDTITEGVSTGINKATGLVSNAFNSASKFDGSFFKSSPITTEEVFKLTGEEQ